MSDPKLISPMLDNFVMGDPISDQNGVRCCPAMEKDSEERYIVKIVSTPASQTQLDALLISGAYSSKEDALAYFKKLASGIEEEAEVLNKLSQLEGFIPFTKWQTEPMEDGNGYDVYLLSAYRQTLKNFLKNHPMTHLEALNLGLDLCAALTICRRCGYMYIDLKPANVYITPEKGYRIGDLGFIKLDKLKYASLPERYRSQYTAPEIVDAYSSLNTTLDIYATGLILYQVFNNGALPLTDPAAPGEAFPPPAFADYEMAEIILKACAPDPADRWQDAVEMGQALVAYMQRNGAHNTPITPVAEEETVSEADTGDLPGNYDSTQEEAADVTEVAEDMADPPEETDTPEDTDAAEQVSATETEEAATTDEVTDTEEDTPAVPEEAVTDQDPELETLLQDITEESIYTEDEDGNLTFITDDAEDETLPGDAPEDIQYSEISEEVSDILEQADEIIAHPAPDPVIQPEPIDVQIPPMEEEAEVPASAQDSGDSDAHSAENTSTADVTEENTDGTAATEASSEPDEQDALQEEDGAPRSRSHWLRNTLLILLALGLLVGGYFFYKLYYLQPIDAILLEDDDNGTLTVLVTTELSDEKLTVICSDTYGNRQTAPVTDGKAVFTNLAPNSAYTVKVAVSGFHKLTGDTSAAYTTPVQTNIVQFTAVTGTEEGSIILSFAIDGPDADQWRISYTGDNNEFKESVFAGHTLTLNGFTVGNAYTFTLRPDSDQRVAGTTEITYTASKIIKPVNLTVTEFSQNKLSAAWNAPEGSTVESWTVRCYNDSGFDNTVVTAEPTASFEITDNTADYTVEVTASGMSVSERVYATANSRLVSDFRVDKVDANTVNLTWNLPADAPRNGWKLSYTADNSAPKELTINGNSATLSPVVPKTTYVFSLQAGDGSAVLGGELTYTAPDIAQFSAYGVSVETMEFRMCKQPSFSGWDRWDLSSSDYGTEFSVGEEAAFVIKRTVEYVHTEDKVTTLFVIRDEAGVLLDATAIPADYWADMWIKGYCYLDIPTIPQTPGQYTVDVYFNGAYAGGARFSVNND